MFFRRPDYEPTAYDDDWEDIPSAGFIPKWFGGMILPVGLIGYSIHCFFTGRGELPGRFSSMTVQGENAIALAAVTVSAAVFLHCHYFWGNIFHLSAAAVLGKIIALIGMIPGMVYLIIHVGILGH